MSTITSFVDRARCGFKAGSDSAKKGGRPVDHRDFAASREIKGGKKAAARDAGRKGAGGRTRGGRFYRELNSRSPGKRRNSIKWKCVSAGVQVPPSAAAAAADATGRAASDEKRAATRAQKKDGGLSNKPYLRKMFFFPSKVKIDFHISRN